MAIPEGTPRRAVEPDALARIMGTLRDLRRDVDALQRGSTLRNASVSGGDGLRVLDEDGNTVVTLTTTDGGGVVASDPGGTEMARFGKLKYSGTGYGVEVNGGDAWVRLGYQATTWDQVAGKPSTFTPSSHTHPGSQITSAVADATGSSHAYNNNVGGTSFYAVWVGNDAGNKLGRNTSSIRYKDNVREHRTAPDAVLNLTPVLYDRKDVYTPPTDPETGEPLVGPPALTPGARNEYGLIAEQVAEHMPELVQWYEGEIDGIRYDLLAVALLNVVKHQEARIAALEAKIQPDPADLPPVVPNVPASAAPTEPPAPTPYEIIPQPPKESPTNER